MFVDEIYTAVTLGEVISLQSSKEFNVNYLIFDFEKTNSLESFGGEFFSIEEEFINNCGKKVYYCNIKDNIFKCI